VAKRREPTNAFLGLLACLCAPTSTTPCNFPHWMTSTGWRWLLNESPSAHEKASERNGTK